MTQKRIEEERAFARQCMVEQIDEMLDKGTQSHDELVARIKGA